MNITLNGKNYELAQQVSVAKLAEILLLAPTTFAIELNLAIVPRSRHSEVMLNEGDVVEIVTFIGGG